MPKPPLLVPAALVVLVVLLVCAVELVVDADALVVLDWVDAAELLVVCELACVLPAVDADEAVTAEWLDVLVAFVLDVECEEDVVPAALMVPCVELADVELGCEVEIEGEDDVLAEVLLLLGVPVELLLVLLLELLLALLPAVDGDAPVPLDDVVEFELIADWEFELDSLEDSMLLAVTATVVGDVAMELLARIG